MKKVGKGSGKKRVGKKWLTMAEARKAVKALEVQGETKTKTMIDLGYSPSTANAHPDILTSNPNFIAAQNELRQAILRKNPAIFTRAAKVINQGLGAFQIKRFSHEGQVVTAFSDPDFETRRKYVELLAKLFGFMDTDPEGSKRPINIGAIYNIVQNSRESRGLPV